MPGRCREEGWCWVKGRGVLPWVLSLLWIQKESGALCVQYSLGDTWVVPITLRSLKVVNKAGRESQEKMVSLHPFQTFLPACLHSLSPPSASRQNLFFGLDPR